MFDWYPIAASSFAGDIDFLIGLIATLVGFWFLLSEAIFFYFIFKFRAKPGVKSEYVTGEEHHETKWIHWPHYAVLACDVAILIFAIRVWYSVKQDLPDPDLTVRIVGQQWAWSFEHPGPDGQLGTADDVKTVDELHLQVGKTYHYKLESRDVLHSFSVPVFRLKQDAIPGRTITGWFKPTVEGEFDLQCAEICGIGHGVMFAKVVIESETAHRQWLAMQAPLPGAETTALGE